VIKGIHRELIVCGTWEVSRRLAGLSNCTAWEVERGTKFENIFTNL
jgi:hypothetical protein